MSERTEAQREASRRNGAQSNGPRTEVGKQISSQNSTKHGFTAATIKLLPGDDPEEFEAYFQAQLERFQPQSAAETHLVRDFSASAWRLRSINNVQTDMITVEARPVGEGKDRCTDPAITIPRGLVRLSNNSNAFTLLMRYAAGLQRQYNALLKELTDIQKQRAKQNEPDKPNKPKQNQSDTPQSTTHQNPTGPLFMQPDPPTDSLQNQPNM